MRGAESVIDINISHGRYLLCKIVLCFAELSIFPGRLVFYSFFFVKAQVLEEHDIAGFKCGSLYLDTCTDAVICENDIFTEEDVLETGKRIMNMRYAFNLREGQRADEEVMPNRAYGNPPLEEGPLKGVTVDRKSLAEQFSESMGWDKESMLPTRESLEKLGGLEDVIRDLYK